VVALVDQPLHPAFHLLLDPEHTEADLYPLGEFAGCLFPVDLGPGSPIFWLTCFLDKTSSRTPMKGAIAMASRLNLPWAEGDLGIARQSGKCVSDFSTASRVSGMKLWR